MATYTEHYNLIKPALNDKVNINNLNDNADIIDTALNNKVNTSDTQDITTSANKCMMSDGVTSVEDILTKKITYDTYAVGRNSSITITLPINFRGCLITSGMSTDSLMGIYIIAVNSAGTSTVIKTISGANKLSVTGSNNILTITNTDGNNAIIALLKF